MPSINFTPGAVSANTNITVPGGVKFNELGSAWIINAGQYTSGSDVAPSSLTVVTTTPSTGEILLVDSETVELGDATTALDHIELNGSGASEFLKVT